MIHSQILLTWLPLALAIIFCAAALLLAYLYLSLKVELRLLIRHTPRRQELDARIQPLESELEQLRSRALENARERNAPVGWSAELSSVHLNRRGQILKLYHKGKTTAEIATDLNISQGEVDLLVKIHDLGPGNSSLAATSSFL